MKERPILFSAPMVRALLDGTKTQTRRVVKPSPERDQLLQMVVGSSGFHYVMDQTPITYPETRRIRWDCPYGQPGDRLWVRETFYAWGRWETRFSAKKGRDEWHFVDMTLESGKAYVYPATESQPQPIGGRRHMGGVSPAWWKRPAIHMPRAASRITLEINGVRVERLQDIGEADAQAEGCGISVDYSIGRTYAAEYKELWKSINGPGSWEANPWVWVVEFKRVEAGAA